MRHAERTDEDVDLALVRVIEEEQPFLPVQRVEGDVRVVAGSAEELLNGTGSALGGDEVQVGVAASERLRQSAHGTKPDRDSAEQTERHGLRVRQVEEALGLGDDVRLDPGVGDVAHHRHYRCRRSSTQDSGDVGSA